MVLKKGDEIVEDGVLNGKQGLTFGFLIVVGFLRYLLVWL
jgi:hypothetical protein